MLYIVKILSTRLLNYKFLNGVLTNTFGLFLHIFGIVHNTRDESTLDTKATLALHVYAIGQLLTSDNKYAPNISICQPYSEDKLTRGKVPTLYIPLIFKQLSSSLHIGPTYYPTY